VNNERKAHRDDNNVKHRLELGPVGGACRTALLVHVVASRGEPEQAPVLGHINEVERGDPA
jgi:hypothetical protein